MVRSFDAEAMEKKAEDAPEMKKTGIDDEREEGHTEEGTKLMSFRS